MPGNRLEESLSKKISKVSVIRGPSFNPTKEESLSLIDLESVSQPLLKLIILLVTHSRGPPLPSRQCTREFFPDSKYLQSIFRETWLAIELYL